MSTDLDHKVLRDAKASIKGASLEISQVVDFISVLALSISLDTASFVT